MSFLIPGKSPSSECYFTWGYYSPCIFLLISINWRRVVQSYPTLRDPMVCLWNSPSRNTGVDCHALLWGLFPTRGSNLGLLHCRWVLYCLSHQGLVLVYFNTYAKHTCIKCTCMYIKCLKKCISILLPACFFIFNVDFL